jgi:conjugal transfer pilus assembly protein TraF
MRYLLIVLSLCPFLCYANFTDSPAQGFHWYTHKVREVKHTKKEPMQTSVITTLSDTQKLSLLTQATKNTLAHALMNPTEENTARYMYAQQYWAKQDQAFVHAWQSALLKHPDLDYNLNYPTDNNAIPVRNDERHLLVEKTITEMPKHYGLILYYQGRSSISQKFISQIILPLIQNYHFALMSVTVDGQPIIGLPNPRSVSMARITKKLHLQARYMPCVYLVNLKTHAMTPASYGFMSLGDFKVRLLDVLTDFKRYTYKGLGETNAH